jgi:hypothetical protein
MNVANYANAYCPESEGRMLDLFQAENSFFCLYIHQGSTGIYLEVAASSSKRIRNLKEKISASISTDICFSHYL